MKWLGPAKVLGQDGKVIFAIHGGHLVRVASTRVREASDLISDNVTDITDIPETKVIKEKNDSSYEIIENEANQTYHENLEMKNQTLDNENSRSDKSQASDFTGFIGFTGFSMSKKVIFPIRADPLRNF